MHNIHSKGSYEITSTVTYCESTVWKMVWGEHFGMGGRENHTEAVVNQVSLEKKK